MTRSGVLEHLTPRQREIAGVAATSSFSNKELAAKLGISEGTLKLHLHEIYRRLRIDGRKALIVDAIHEPGPHESGPPAGEPGHSQALHRS